MKIIECRKLNIGYVDKLVCTNISFSVEKGQYVCIIGENGSGKSTLIKTILGLNKPLSGRVIFGGHFNKSHVGYLPQQTEFQKDFPATVREIVMSGFLGRMGFRPFYNKVEKEKCGKILSQLGATDYQDKSFKDLSGGQQQRVLLARALCATDELLVLDEPTNGLDVRTIKHFYELISKLNRENGLTVLMVTHSIENVIKYATHIIYLKDNMEFVGSKEEFLNSEHAKYFKLGGE